jgi:cation transport ATPase
MNAPFNPTDINLNEASAFAVTGMTCNGCRTKVEKALEAFAPGTIVTLEPPVARFAKPISADTANEALAAIGKYRLTEPLRAGETEPAPAFASQAMPTTNEGQRSWFETYKPLLIIAVFVSVASLAGTATSPMPFHDWMLNFMAGFYLVFAAFKFLDLRGFADAYSTYDIVAKAWRPWGSIYPFVELALGLAYLFRFQVGLANWVALIVMSVSIVGVVQSVRRNETIRCACLGTALNLPMSTVTIVEDGLMIAMAAMMIWMM